MSCGKNPTTIILNNFVLGKAFNSSRLWLNLVAVVGGPRPSPLFANLELYMLLGLACQQVKEQSNSFRHCPWRFNARTRGPCFAACLNPLIASHPWLTRELPT